MGPAASAGEKFMRSIVAKLAHFLVIQSVQVLPGGLSPGIYRAISRQAAGWMRAKRSGRGLCVPPASKV